MKKIIFLFMLFLCIKSLYASEGYTDVIYHKNGSIIKGTIIEQVPNKSLKIRLKDGSVFVFSYNDIDRIAKDESVVCFKNKGYYNVTEFGFLTGIAAASDGVHAISIKMVNGYQFNSHFSTGFGIGYDIYDDSGNKRKVIPFFINTRFNVLKNRITPYIFIDAGYSYGWTPYQIYLDDNPKWEGLMLNPGLGVKAFLSENSAIVASISYKYQKTKDTYTYWNESLEVFTFVDQDEYSFLCLSAGISF